jgi:hypothetical protein
MVNVWLKILLYSLFVIVLVGGGSVYVLARSSAFPSIINMGSMGHDMSAMKQKVNTAVVSVASLKEGASDAPVKSFELTAEEKELDIGNGKKVQALTLMEQRLDRRLGCKREIV